MNSGRECWVWVLMRSVCVVLFCRLMENRSCGMYIVQHMQWQSFCRQDTVHILTCKLGQL